MRNCLCIILFLVFSLTIPATSVYAYGDGGGGGEGGGVGDAMIETESTTSDTTSPPSGFKPGTQESADSEITTSSETDPGKEEEVAELVEEVNLMEETAEEGEVEGDSTDSVEDTTSDEKAPDENTSAEDQGDKKSEELATLVDDINPHGSAQESETTRQPDPGQGLIGTQGTLPGTKSATLDSISTEKNEDGSVSTWATYSNDTWVRTTVNPDGTHEVTIMLDSGTIIRPGREYIHTGGSLNPLLDYTIGVLEVAAAAGTVAGWVLTVTPAGALASGGIKTAQATWAVTVGVQAVRTGVDDYGQKINEGATQSEAAWSGVKQTAANAVITTGTGKFFGDEKTVGMIRGMVKGKAKKALIEIAHKQTQNVFSAGMTEKATGTNPGYGPGIFK